MPRVQTVMGGDFQKCKQWKHRRANILNAQNITTQFGERTRVTLVDLDNGETASILMSCTPVRDLLVDYFDKNGGANAEAIGPVVMAIGNTKGGATWIFYDADKYATMDHSQEPEDAPDESEDENARFLTAEQP